MQNQPVEKRITQIRLTVWTLAGLLAFCCFRAAWPLAWQVAAFGALFTLLWPRVRGQGSGIRGQEEEEKTEDRRQKTEDSGLSTINCQLSTDSFFILHPSSFVQIGLDLLVTTLLIGVSGGFGSPFALLVFGVALETFALLGSRAAVQAACLTALLNLVHFQSGVTPTSAIVYGLAMGTLVAAMLIVKMAQAREAEDNPRSHNSALARPPDVAELQAQLEAAWQTHEEMKDRYRAVISLNRDQKTQVARTRAIEQLCELGGESLASDRDGRIALARVLRLVMDITGAEGGVLWLRGRGGDTLTVQAAEGRIADAARQDALLNVNALPADAIRAHCEAALLNAAPTPLPMRSRLDALLGPGHRGEPEDGEDTLVDYAIVAPQPKYAFEASPVQAMPVEAMPGEVIGLEAMMDIDANSGNMRHVESDFDLLLAPTAAAPRRAHPPAPGLVGVTLLRTRPTSAEPMGKILGAVGVCAPRRRERFLSSELEKVSALCRALTAAIHNICERAEAQKQIREVTLLQELRRMAQATNDNKYNSHGENLDVEQVYERVVEAAMELAPCENCTLFLLDARGQRLEAKATRGQNINLLDHIRFERGHGLSGWVASRGRPLNIADLTQERNLLNVEAIAPQVRSFLALPLRIENTILGVINISHAHPHAFTPRDVRLLTELAEYAAFLLFAEDRRQKTEDRRQASLL